MTTRKGAGRSRTAESTTCTTGATAATTADSTLSTAPAGDPDEIRADIERTRDGLGDSVEALAAKADVKTRTRESLAAAKDRAKNTAAQAGETVRRKRVPVVATLASAVAAVTTVVLMRRRRATKNRFRDRFRDRLRWPR